MAIEGHCNCASIKITIPELPSHSSVCFCANCRRAGSGILSVNYLFDLSDVEVHDLKGTMRNYRDTNTKTGNTITRRFCGECGSPIMTLLPKGTKIILKAGLFDQIPPPISEVFGHAKVPWVKIDAVGRTNLG
ncbi:hypothetical protein CC78DRAFT_536563, partial [Lojkania enalia]